MCKVANVINVAHMLDVREPANVRFEKAGVKIPKLPPFSVDSL